MAADRRQRQQQGDGRAPAAATRAAASARPAATVRTVQPSGWTSSAIAPARRSQAEPDRQRRARRAQHPRGARAGGGSHGWDGAGHQDDDGAAPQAGDPVVDERLPPLGGEAGADLVAHLGEGPRPAVAQVVALVDLEPGERFVVGGLRRRVEALPHVALDPGVVLEPGQQPAGRDPERGEPGLAARAGGPRLGVGAAGDAAVDVGERGREALDLGSHQLADDQAVDERGIVERGRARHEIERPRRPQIGGHDRLAGHDGDEAIRDDAPGPDATAAAAQASSGRMPIRTPARC